MQKYELNVFLPCAKLQSRKISDDKKKEIMENLYKKEIVSLVFVFNLNGRLARKEDIVSTRSKTRRLIKRQTHSEIDKNN